VLPHSYLCIAEGLDYFYAKSPDWEAVCNLLDFQSCGSLSWKVPCCFKCILHDSCMGFKRARIASLGTTGLRLVMTMKYAGSQRAQGTSVRGSCGCNFSTHRTVQIGTDPLDNLRDTPVFVFDPKISSQLKHSHNQTDAHTQHPQRRTLHSHDPTSTSRKPYIITHANSSSARQQRKPDTAKRLQQSHTRQLGYNAHTSTQGASNGTLPSTPEAPKHREWQATRQHWTVRCEDRQILRV
jgi:hypothetical protein